MLGIQREVIQRNVYLNSSLGLTCQQSWLKKNTDLFFIQMLNQLETSQ